MVREGLARKRVGDGEGFRWRGEDVWRVEGFSDAVFAFAVTLLVVSLQVPSTFDELLETMRMTITNSSGATDSGTTCPYT